MSSPSPARQTTAAPPRAVFHRRTVRQWQRIVGLDLSGPCAPSPLAASSLKAARLWQNLRSASPSVVRPSQRGSFGGHPMPSMLCCASTAGRKNSCTGRRPADCAWPTAPVASGGHAPTGTSRRWAPARRCGRAQTSCERQARRWHVTAGMPACCCSVEPGAVPGRQPLFPRNGRAGERRRHRPGRCPRHRVAAW